MTSGRSRRSFLTVLSVGVGAWAAGCASGSVGPPHVGDTPLPDVAHSSAPTSSFRPPPTTPRVPAPHRTLTALPGEGNSIALTIDDGTNADVVGAYIKFARETDARFTFFVTGIYDSWRTHQSELRKLVESGKIQLGNHTWTHPDLTSLPSHEVEMELKRTQRFLLDSFGVDGTPFYRPPYGYHDERVDTVAASLGYTTPTMWYGSLEDSGLISEEYLLDCARKYLQAQAIVIGHANHLPVTRVYPQLLDILHRRRLSMVTLNDVFDGNAARNERGR